jgi:hypothetical protein
MKFIRWALATKKREDAKWLCMVHEMNHSFVLAVGDDDKIKKHEATLVKARHDYSQLTWANI